MKVIRLDAAAWKNARDFYAAILPALGAPSWHGTNVNALVESMVQGKINAVEPPFKVEVVRSRLSTARVQQELAWTAEDTEAALADFARRQGHRPDVSFNVLS